MPRPGTGTTIVVHDLGATEFATHRALPEGASGSCRNCGAPLSRVFVDLGTSPLCESYIEPADYDLVEPFFPLRAFVCEECLLVQLRDYVGPETIFGDYVYFSSFSDSWVEHAHRFVDSVAERFELDATSFVVEVASNDGYLLQHFVARGVRVLGIESARNVAAVARERGVPTETVFLGEESGRRIAAEHGRADLVVANNVFANVPGLHDFTAGLAELLSQDGVLTLEFPHLMRLVAENQFDTIYHEHFSYFSLHTATDVLAAHGLDVVAVEEIPTHGGSLRVYARNRGVGRADDAVAELLEREREAGMTTLAYYDFAVQVESTKQALLTLLIDAKQAGCSIVGYGAPRKGNTLLNYCGIRTDFLDYTVDRSPHKQGLFLPGTRIPIHHPERIAETRPDYILILPWNLADEIIEQLAYTSEWGAKFIVPIPYVHLLCPSPRP